MSTPDPRDYTPWDDATLVAALFAVDPVGTGGVCLRALPGPVRDQWLNHTRELLPPEAPVRRVPVHIADGRLLGGLDLTATLQAGRPVAERGVLADAHNGVVIMAMVERLPTAMAARLAAVLDAGEVALERDGIALRSPARLGVIALDEGISEDERPPTVLLDRLAFLVDLSGIAYQSAVSFPYDLEQITEARHRLPQIEVSESILEVLCATALMFGITSLRAPLHALKVARASAALAGRNEVSAEDAAIAGRLALAPRATIIPVMEEESQENEAEEPPPEQPPEPPPDQPPQNDEPPKEDEELQIDMDQLLEDLVLEATKAAIPAGLLAQLKVAGGSSRGQARSGGRAGAVQKSRQRGRPAGTYRGELRSGVRLNVIETLRAAAPWQPIRRRERLRELAEEMVRRSARVEVRSDDFRITRLKQRSQTTSIFVVDASGSAALHRLAEAKGAVELLLADCYVRRDRVALIAFRGSGAELLLPPTRSLVRAKRSLAGLPGGGGTPLAAGIEAAWTLADTVKRQGDTPVLIFLTDGKANIGRDGNPGRAKANEDAITAARMIRVDGMTALLVDTSPRPQPTAQTLAQEMGARYLPLPFADANTLSIAVQAVTA